MALVGSTISSPTCDYHVKEILGIGTFGKVALCKKKRSTNLVALKIIEDEKAIRASENEAKFLNIMRGLDSQKYNIVEFAGSFMAGKLYCLEFERLHMSLMDYTIENSVELEEIRPIMQQMVVALNFLKGIKLVHGDLKPENIMMVDPNREPLRVKLIDFGLAHNDPQRRTGDISGTLPYTSPEMLVGAPYNHAIDVWAFGCIAIEMLIGNELMAGEDDSEVLRSIISILGNVPDTVLKRGRYTKNHFVTTYSPERTKTFSLKSTADTGCTIKSLTELLQVPEGTPREDILAVKHDRAMFVNLVSKMLNMDHYERITPSDILNHPFLTLSHLDSGCGSYLQRSTQLMRICPNWHADGDKVAPRCSSQSEECVRECSSTQDNQSGRKTRRDSEDHTSSVQQTEADELRNTPDCSSRPKKIRRTMRKSISEDDSTRHKSKTPPKSQRHLMKRKRDESDSKTDFSPVKKRRLHNICEDPPRTQRHLRKRKCDESPSETDSSPVKKGNLDNICEDPPRTQRHLRKRKCDESQSETDSSLVKKRRHDNICEDPPKTQRHLRKRKCDESPSETDSSPVKKGRLDNICEDPPRTQRHLRKRKCDESPSETDSSPVKKGRLDNICEDPPKTQRHLRKRKCDKSQSKTDSSPVKKHRLDNICEDPPKTQRHLRKRKCDESQSETDSSLVKKRRHDNICEDPPKTQRHLRNRKRDESDSKTDSSPVKKHRLDSICEDPPKIQKHSRKRKRKRDESDSDADSSPVKISRLDNLCEDPPKIQKYLNLRKRDDSDSKTDSSPVKKSRLDNLCEDPPKIQKYLSLRKRDDSDSKTDSSPVKKSMLDPCTIL